MRRLIPDAVLEEAAAPYRELGRFAWGFTRGKLSRDPAFMGILENRLIPDRANILDLGCGQGSLAAWLLAAADIAEKGKWPVELNKPPSSVRIRGIELMPKAVARARAALGDRAVFTCGDICTGALGESDVVVILDVLHYIDYSAQEALIERVKDSLKPHGRLLLRVGDAAAGISFKFSKLVDHIVVLTRDHRFGSLYCRPIQAWVERLQQLGFAVRTLPMSSGTPFANVLIVADLR